MHAFKVETIIEAARQDEQRGFIQDALDGYRQAAAQAPEETMVYNELAMACLRHGRLDEAIAVLEKGIEKFPDEASFYLDLAEFYYLQKNPDKALEVLKQGLKIAPDHPQLRYLMFSWGGEAPPERAPNDFLETYFDHMAERYEELLAYLAYSVPRYLPDFLLSHTDLADGDYDILDLGCGTGLMAAALKSYAKKLVGVDISLNMLEEARKKRLYDNLHHEDFLKINFDQQFDYIVAGDVLCYHGELADVFARVQKWLKPGGYFVASFETTDYPHYMLQTTGRFAHHPGDVNRQAKEYGLKFVDQEKLVLRYDLGKPIDGVMMLWQKAA